MSAVLPSPQGRPAWFRRRIRLAPPPASAPRPAVGSEAALARFAALSAADNGVPDATRSRLFEPDGAALATLVIWHGFTNAPSQFTAVAERLQAAGYRVLLPRMPYHGLPDVLTRDLLKLTEAQLVAQVDECVDIAAGFGDPVWLLGLSAGATMAAWGAATRPEVSRVVLAAPLAAPVGFPMLLVRLFARFPRIVPRIYWWWDPRVKDRIVGSPYAYPGFPLPAIMSFLKLSEWLFDGSVRVGHPLERTVLLTNPGDFAIRKDVARAFTSAVFSRGSTVAAEACIDPELKWMHDFVDPRSDGSGTTDQVVAVLLAALGESDPSAGGVLVPPLLP